MLKELQNLVRIYDEMKDDRDAARAIAVRAGKELQSWVDGSWKACDRKTREAIEDCMAFDTSEKPEETT